MQQKSSNSCKKKFFNTIGKIKKIILIQIPETQVDSKTIEGFDLEYVLIMFSGNEFNSGIKEESKWNANFSKLVSSKMTPNMRGSESRNQHHSCMGKYNGFGMISKYSINNKLSVDSFSHNNINNESVKDIIETLNNNICYTIDCQHHAMPLSLYCCFAITLAMIEFIQMHKDKCANLLKLIKENKCHPEYLSMCNFICEEAKTRDFHQEFDSSYTFITVPQ